MRQRSMGFVGGGRVVRILLGGLQRAGKLPADCVVADASEKVLDQLGRRFPGIRPVGADISEASRQALVFGALHPPALGEALPAIAAHLGPEAVFVSLAPRLTLERLATALGGSRRLARMIPNAPSLIGEGFNPIAFSGALSAAERAEIREILGALGECVEVADGDLEAYAILTAMGPTYFWYQFEELAKLGVACGLAEEAVNRALARMLHGAVDTYFGSGLSPEEVIDLIPVKPMAEFESATRRAYRSALVELHGKLTAR